MKKIYFFLFSALIALNLNAQILDEKLPDYTIIQFRSYVKEYKKEKPSFDEVNFDKEDISDIVRLLGAKFYSQEERIDITEKIWLAMSNPKQFDFVYKDYAVRSFPNWDKPNFQGKLVLEPNIYLKDWTKSESSIDYFKLVLHRILMYQGLMGYGENAKETKKTSQRLLYAKKFLFRPVYTRDWTNTYLQTLVPQAAKSNNIVMVTEGNYQFMIVEAEKQQELLKLFKKMNWNFLIP